MYNSKYTTNANQNKFTYITSTHRKYNHSQMLIINISVIILRKFSGHTNWQIYPSKHNFYLNSNKKEVSVNSSSLIPIKNTESFRFKDKDYIIYHFSKII